MSRELIQKFHADFQVKGAVKEYLTNYLRDIAVKRAFAGEDTTGIREANLVIEKAFKDLDIQFSVKERKAPRSTR